MKEEVRGDRADRIDIEALLRQGRTLQIMPQGFSMYPLLYPGRDEVILRAADPEELKRGDVVLYRREGSILVLHRILRKRAEGFYMVGDNQTEVEGPVSAEQIRGVMTGFIRKGRAVSVNNPAYRAVSGIWLLLRPFRRCIAVPVAKLRRRRRSR